VSYVIGSASTSRLRLVRWSSLFDEEFAAMNADPEVMRHLTAGVPMTAEESRALSARFAEHWERHGFGLWAAELAATGEFLGFAGLQHPGWFEAMADEVEVGWRLTRASWGHGYATEAAVAGLRTAFTVLELPRVISLIAATNIRSIAVAGRLGLRLEDVVAHPGDASDVAVYAISAEEWEARSSASRRRQAPI
jgi:RimJ/RimL family protein N-acetyltransferase